MRSTLFYLPHHLLGLPVLGFGWGLLGLILWSLFYLLWRYRRDGDWRSVQESVPVWGIVACLIVFVFPNLETHIDDGSPNGIHLGLPIRGYGVMLMLGAISGVAVTAYRSTRIGITLDELLSLAVWCCISGILGARTFYVVQKWDELPGLTFADKIWTTLKFTEGGLVVYGSVLGGLAAMVLWSLKRRRSPWTILDLVAPGFMVGLSLGRIGCFLHGCCFGGLCEVSNLPKVEFPSGSEPYLAQVYRGELLGLTLDRENRDGVRTITKVRTGSWGDSVGLRAGQAVQRISPQVMIPAVGKDPAGPQPTIVQMEVDGKVYTSQDMPLPSRSLPLHPAQIYSSINAILIAGVLFYFWPIRRRDGDVFALWLCLYGVVRILEEWIRADELGQFGTELTIAQWISILGIVSGLVIFFLRRQTASDDQPEVVST